MSRFTIKFSDNIPLNKHSCAHQTCTYKMLAKLNPGARICKKNASSSSLSALSRSLITHGPCKRVACCGEFGQSGLGACGVRIPLRRPAGGRPRWLLIKTGVRGGRARSAPPRDAHLRCGQVSLQTRRERRRGLRRAGGDTWPAAAPAKPPPRPFRPRASTPALAPTTPEADDAARPPASPISANYRVQTWA